MTICLQDHRVLTQNAPNAINSPKLHTTYICVFEDPADPFTAGQQRKFPGALDIKPVQSVQRTVPCFLKIQVCQSQTNENRMPFQTALLSTNLVILGIIFRKTSYSWVSICTVKILLHILQQVLKTMKTTLLKCIMKQLIRVSLIKLSFKIEKKTVLFQVVMLSLQCLPNMFCLIILVVYIILVVGTYPGGDERKKMY